MKLWAAEGENGLYCRENGEKKRLRESCFTLCPARCGIFGMGSARGFRCDTRGNTLFDFPAPPGVCAMASGQTAVFALSAEADCVCAFDPEKGDLLFSAPTGSYPRDLCLSPCGRYIAVAAGGAGEILLLDRELACVFRQKTAGVPCGICFLPHALAALCAVESGETLLSRLMLISPRGVEKESFTYPAAPCSLCAVGDHCLLGCQGRVFDLKPDGKIAACRAFQWPARVKSSLIGPLVCDPWQGSVARMDGKCLYTGQGPVDVCLTE